MGSTKPTSKRQALVTRVRVWLRNPVTLKAAFMLVRVIGWLAKLYDLLD